MSWGRRSSGFGYTDFDVNKQFKERLTGAVILVVFAVVVVPALLSGPPRPAATTASAGGEGPPVRSYTIDLTDPAGALPPAAPVTVAPTAAPMSAPTAVPDAVPAPAALVAVPRCVMVA